MLFVKTFQKTADLDRDRGGNEFDRSKNEPEIYAASSASDSEPPPYMPLDVKKKTADKKKADDALFIAQGKMAEGVGTQNLSDTDPGLADQLKSEGLTPEKLGYQEPMKKKFARSFRKNAGAFDQVGKVLSGLKSGLSAAGKSSVGEAAKLKGLGHIGHAIKSSGGIVNAIKTESGRKALAEGVGKAAPSIAAATAYGAVAKKIYDKAAGGSGDQYYYQQG